MMMPFFCYLGSHHDAIERVALARPTFVTAGRLPQSRQVSWAQPDKSAFANWHIHPGIHHFNIQENLHQSTAVTAIGFLSSVLAVASQV
ncbi:hypothetical protein [Ferrovum myxofaciens]|jgi:hypothetical protein|nr:hypothetical protein [Ferrovum myxofaciens]